MFIIVESKDVDTCWVYEWMVHNGEIVQTVLCEVKKVERLNINIIGMVVVIGRVIPMVIVRQWQW